MNQLNWGFWLIIAQLGLMGNNAIAQITPDTTLPNNSAVIRSGKIITIDEGTVNGSNLFHSFSEFSVDTGETAFFNNGVNIDNILTRVTGGQLSSIDGLIQANGTANLFLLNPNGLQFGPNASFNLGGSFVGSTAESFLFEDGSIYSAINPTEPPLLAVNVPIGLQYGSNPNPIQVEESNLQVETGQTLSLAGGDLEIIGGQLQAPSGRIGLGSTTEGILRLDESLGIAGLSDFTKVGNINLSQQSLVEVTGASEGIDITTGNLTLTEGSRIQSVTEVPGQAGDIQLNFTETITIDGFGADGLFSGILSYSLSENGGTSGNITINQSDNLQGDLTLSNRGFIATVTQSKSNSGDIEVNVNNLDLISGGQIVSLTTGGGNSGYITVNATEVLFISGSNAAFQPSPFEDIEALSLDQLEFSTTSNPDVSESGAIPYVSVERTPEQVISGTTVLGDAAEQYDYYSFTVTAPNSRIIIDLDGGDGYEKVPGSFDSEVFLFNQATGEVIAANDDSNPESGGGGSLVIQDSYLDTTVDSPGTYVVGVGEFDTLPDPIQLLEGDRIDPGDTYTLKVSVQNQGTEFDLPTNLGNPDNFNPNYGAESGLVNLTESNGNAGPIMINTNRLFVENEGKIATTTFGSGVTNNLVINATKSVQINNRSTISNITRGSGNTGNVIINTEDLNLNNIGDIILSNFDQGNTGDLRINVHNVSLTNGSVLNNNTYLRGDAGKVIINAHETVVVDGEFDENTSQIRNFVGGPSAVGNAGGVEINSRFFFFTNGASLNSTTYGEGNAAGVTINASEQAILSGRSLNSRGSGIRSRIRGTGVGNAGDINITTKSLQVIDGARLLSQTEGVGNAANINIIAENIILNEGFLSSSVESTAIGNGGQLSLIFERLILSNGSEITASTSGEGDGGANFSPRFGVSFLG